jgi:hypothetical protein
MPDKRETRIQRERRLWRLAQQLATQLPDDHREAQTVLRHLGEIEDYVNQRLVGSTGLVPVPLPAGQRLPRFDDPAGVVVGINASDNRRAKSNGTPSSLPK